MAKQTINLGTGELTGDGESIRSAFSKINDNFDELYTQDSSDVVLSAINGHIIPDTDVTYDLGSATNRFRDLYLSGSTIDLGGTTLSVVGGELQVGGVKVPTIADVTATIPSNINDLGDVALTDPVNGDLLTYFNGEWVNAALLNYVTAGSNVSVLNNDAGYITAADIAGGTLTIDVNNTGNLEGSVYSNESTLLVDGERGKIVGDVENALINTRAIRSSDTGTGNLLLQGSSTNAGDGGSITIWGGSGFGTGNGGVVTIDAGNASGSGTKGVINIGTSTTATGSVTIGLPLQSSIIVSNDDDSITINGTVDLSNATVTGQGFTYNEDGGTSEIGVTADVFDFGDGKTIDMQNSTVLFTGSTVSGILSLNTDYITIGVGGSINMQGSDIGAAGTVSAVTVNAIDFNGNLSGTVNGDLTGSVFSDDSSGILVDGVAGRIVGPIDTAAEFVGDGFVSINNDAYGGGQYAGFTTDKQIFNIQAASNVGGGDNGGSVIILGGNGRNSGNNGGVLIGTGAGGTAGTADIDIRADGDVAVFSQNGAITFDGTMDFANAGSIQNFAPGDIYAKQDNFLYISSRTSGAITTNATFSYNTDIGNVRQVFYGKTEFGNNGQAPIVDFGGATINNWTDPDVVNEHGGSAVITVGIQTATMDDLTVRIVDGGGTLDVQFNYDAGATATVSANGDLANRFNGTTTFAAGNGTWTVMNTLTTIGDKGEFTIVDHSFHKIYKVTTFAKALPDGGSTAGDAYCVIERLK